MAYTKIGYQNSPSTATPLNAENLNHMDEQIYENDQRLTALEGAHVSSFNGRTGAVASAKGDYDIGQIAPLTGAQVGQVPVVVNVGTEENPELEFQMGAGGGGGHVIQNASGTDLAQEPTMQFVDLHASDDSVGEKTVVESIKNIVKADLANLTEDGIYQTTDEEDVPIGDIEEDSVSVTADGIKTQAQLLNDLYAKIDRNKLTFNTVLERNGGNIVAYFNLIQIRSSYLLFTQPNGGGSSPWLYCSVCQVQASNSLAFDSNTSNWTNNSSTVIPEGYVYTVHYGTSSTIINLKTDARDCMMSDGVTSVESALTKNNLENYIDIKSYNSTSNPYTFPEDGYLYVGARDNGDNCFCKVYGNDMKYSTEMRARSYSSLSWDISTLFVKKGMKFVYDSGSGTTIARYMKLV